MVLSSRGHQYSSGGEHLDSLPLPGNCSALFPVLVAFRYLVLDASDLSCWYGVLWVGLMDLVPLCNDWYDVSLISIACEKQRNGNLEYTELRSC